MDIQWYPGHMSKAKKQMQEDIRLIDLVIELVDARIPISSKNPDIDELAKGKARIILLNKADMADSNITELWKQYYEGRGFIAVTLNSKNTSAAKKINEVIQRACKDKLERDRKKGIINRPIRAMVVGIPNVGKSTFINSIAGRACTKTGNKPGVTKGKQWIRLNKGVELLDTPGILWPKFGDIETGLNIAYIGSINDNILNKLQLAYKLEEYLFRNYKGSLTRRYGIEECEDMEENLSRIAQKRGCLLKGGLLNREKAADFILDDFRNGRLGAISLEIPTEENERAE